MYHARDSAYASACTGSPGSSTLLPSGRRNRPALAGACLAPAHQLHNRHGIGSHDCENPLKHKALIALVAGLLAPLAGHAAPSLAGLYSAYEEAGYSSLGLEQLNQTVQFTAVSLGASSNLQGEPVLEAGDEDGQVLARLTASDDEQNAKLAAMEDGVTFTASCTLQFSSGSDYLALGDCVLQ